MKNAKDFDVRQFAPESSATVTTDIGGDVRPSKRSVSSERSELTERDEVVGQTVPTPSSRQTERPRQTASTSATEQSVSSHQTAPAQSIEQIQLALSTQPIQQRTSIRQRRASLDEYKGTFLSIPKITDRQPVFVSRDVRDKIDGVVRWLGQRKMSVSGFLENLARHHLDLYADDLEQWKRL